MVERIRITADLTSLRVPHIPAGTIVEAQRTEEGGWLVIKPAAWGGLGIPDDCAVPLSVPCGNCGTYRSVDAEGNVETCPYCGDDEWNLVEATEANVP